MPDINQSSWSETDANNNAASPNGWTSGVMLPSQVEPTARGMMGAIKRWFNRLHGTQTSAGSANAHTLTYSVAPAGLVTGDTYTFKAGNTNTGATTLNVNSLGAVAVQINGQPLVGNELISGHYHTVIYDGANFQLMNPGALYSGTGYTGENFRIYRTDLTPAGVDPAMRVLVSSKGDATNFIGGAGLYIGVSDNPSVVSGTRGVLYGVQISMQPNVTRGGAGAGGTADDVAAIVISNDGAVASVVECIYVGVGALGAGTREWGAILGSDASSLYYLKATGHYGTGIEFAAGGANYAQFSSYAMHVPNNCTIIAARNAADSADFACLATDSSNNVIFGAILSSNTTNTLTTNTGANRTVLITANGNYNVLALNGVNGSTTHTGLTCGATGDDNLYVDAGGIGEVVIRTSGTTETARFLSGGGLHVTSTTAPGTPASGWTLYVDSGDGNKLKAKASTGTVITLGTP